MNSEQLNDHYSLLIVRYQLFPVASADRVRASQVAALCVINANFPEYVQGLLVFDALGDGVEFLCAPSAE